MLVLVCVIAAVTSGVHASLSVSGEGNALSPPSSRKDVGGPYTNRDIVQDLFQEDLLPDKGQKAGAPKCFIPLMPFEVVES